MRLGIDASNLLDGGGVTHLEELLRAAEPSSFGFSEVVVWGRSKTLDQLSHRPWLRLVPEPSLDGNLLARTKWQVTSLDRLAREARCDLLFVPGGSYSGSFRPFVSMARNLVPFDAKASRLYGISWMRLKFALLRRVQSRTFRSASGVIFLTSTAQSVVTSVTGPLVGRTEVIPHGISDRFLREVQPQEPLSRYSESRPFRLLYVSRLEPYKHQPTVISTVLKLREEGYPVVLDLVGSGGGGARQQIERQLHAEDREGVAVTYHGNVPYADLPALYHRADAFVFASSCENLPNILLEAMSAGLPIASSNRSVMPEVLGDAGLYFDPESPESMASALRDLLANPERRRQLAIVASERVRDRTWVRCAERTLAFLGSIGMETHSGGG
ncbi:MAG: glycosyltransferase family 4 protein [Gemmatimonadota bacterium]|nr:glycosyltransferase family 4 protein [Gemmatimonadota bacterium]